MTCYKWPCKKDIYQVVAELSLGDIGGPNRENQFFQFSFPFGETTVVVGHEFVNDFQVINRKYVVNRFRFHDHMEADFLEHSFHPRNRF